MMKQLIIAGLALLPAVFGGAFLLLRSGRRSEQLQARIQGLSRLEQGMPEQAGRKSLQKSRNANAGFWVRLNDAVQAALAETPKSLTPWRLAASGLFTSILVGTLISLLFSPSWIFVIPIAVTAGLATPFGIVTWVRGKRKTEILASLPDALDLIVRALRAGLPLSEAFNSLATELPGPLAEEFRLLNGEISIGINLEEAIGNAAERIDLPDFRFFSASISLQRETGGNLTETLQNLSQIIRRRKELQLKARAMTAEARTSSLVIGALPFVACGALAIINPEYIAKLINDPRGAYVIGAACTSMSLGVLTMHLLIKRSVN